MSDLISREFLQTAIHNFFNGLNHTPTEEDIQRYIEVAPSADIMECARAIKEYCVNRVSHNPTMCDRCPIYKVMCEPDISCPYHWDLPEGDKE